MRFPLTTLAVWCCAWSALIGSSARAQTIDDVIAKHIEARGGAEKIAAMKSFRQTGQLDLGNGQKATLTMAYKRPNLMRMEMMVPRMPPAVRAFDGRSGWTFMPQMGKRKPESADDATQRELVEEADFAGPLIDWKQKGHKLELAGREQVDGKDCYKVNVTRADTREQRQYYLDTNTFLEVQVTGTQASGSFTQKLSDNKKVDGLTFPFTSVVEVVLTNGQKQQYTYKVEKIEINPDLPDEQFTMPTTMPSK